MDARGPHPPSETSEPSDFEDPGADPGQTIMPRGERSRRAELAAESRGSLAAEDGGAVLPARDLFRLVEKVASGGMGDIYRAHQASLLRDVAVKRIRADKAEIRTSGAEDFLSEALTTAYLDHPNIVPIHQLIEVEDGAPAIAMKLISGTSWRDLIHGWTPELEERASEYDLERHIEVLVDVCDAVAFAHAKGIIHRDVKPSNVMVGEYGEVFLTDWGMAVSYLPEAAYGLRAPFKSVVREPSGTPSYLAPEMAEGRGDDLGPWTDVYLLGGCLHEVLTRRPPHLARKTRDSVKSSIASRPPKFEADVPAEIAAICRRALSRRPEDRYPDVAGFRQALRGFLGHRQSATIERAADDRLATCGRDRLGARLSDEDERIHAYTDLSEALAGYRQAILLWSGNRSAAEKEIETRLVFASAAVTTGDFALARMHIEGLDGSEVREIKRDLVEAERARDRVAAAARRLRVAAVAAAIVIIVGLAAGLVLISREKTRADANATEARHQARTAERNLQLANANARRAEELAGEARTTAERAKTEAREKTEALEELAAAKARTEKTSRELEESARRTQEALEALQRSVAAARENERRASAQKVRADAAENDALASQDQAREEARLRRSALAELERLADVVRARRYRTTAEKLLAARPLNTAELGRWLDDVADLLSREVLHRRTLIDLQRAASPPDSEEIANILRRVETRLDDVLARRAALAEEADAVAKARALRDLNREEERLARACRLAAEASGYRYASDDEAWRVEVLVELIQALREFRIPETGPIARIEAALAAASPDRATGADDALWREALGRIERSSVYRGLVLEAQDDLRPLGVDPDSGLEEFLHVPSHRGETPVRSSSGRLELTDDTGLVFVLLPPASQVWMGSQSTRRGRHYSPDARADEGPPHRVSLDGFLIAKHEMTQGQWIRMGWTNPSALRAGEVWHERTISPRHPVEQMTWDDCAALASAGLQLPTEAQWEYAARGKTSSPWWTGSSPASLARAANLADESRRELDGGTEPWSDGFVVHAPVGTSAPNGFGLYDVLGNVAEWCFDEYASYDAPLSPGDGRRRAESTSARPTRGGSFRDRASEARSSSRRSRDRSYADATTGFRPARSLD